jgi:hypothetical protein
MLWDQGHRRQTTGPRLARHYSIEAVIHTVHFAGAEGSHADGLLLVCSCAKGTAWHDDHGPPRIADQTSLQEIVSNNRQVRKVTVTVRFSQQTLIKHRV